MVTSAFPEKIVLFTEMLSVLKCTSDTFEMIGISKKTEILEDINFDLLLVERIILSTLLFSTISIYDFISSKFLTTNILSRPLEPRVER